MIDLINTIQSIGDQALEFILFPLLIWTAIALPVALCLHFWDAVPPVVHYHSRIALLVTLPLGIAGTCLFNLINSAASATGSAALFVIQNPISVAVTEPGTATVSFVSDPSFWIGASSLLLAVGVLWMIFKFVINYMQLKQLQHQLSFSPLAQNRDVISKLPRLPGDAKKTLIAFSKQANIPFTFGWRTTRIVIPADLREDSDALAMAVQHELIHIKHHDFLLNSLLVLLKAFFWFHPLVHYLHNSGQEYREITCDGEVLADKQFSKKRYASLLFELARRDHQKNIAISMAVNPSSLKKRIKIMSTQNNVPTTFRSSFLATLLSAALMVVAISCTDMADSGITNTELEHAQVQIKKGAESPLYIVNGERWDNNEENKEKIARLNPKYIKSITVLKGAKAIKKYGEAAKNGAIELMVNNPQKAFTDLTDLSKQRTSESGEEFYLAVDEMPELVGGLAGLQQKIVYPEEARNAGAEGRVIVQFIVDEQGNVQNPQVIKGDHESLNEETLRVVKQAKFEPGMHQGEPVRVQYSLPITYKLPSGEGE